MTVFPLDAAVFTDEADVYLSVCATAPRGTREQNRRLAVDELGILERADLAAGVDVYAGIAQAPLLFPRGTAVVRNRIPAVAREQIKDAVDFDNRRLRCLVLQGGAALPGNAVVGVDDAGIAITLTAEEGIAREHDAAARRHQAATRPHAVKRRVTAGQIGANLLIEHERIGPRRPCVIRADEPQVRRRHHMELRLVEKHVLLHEGGAAKLLAIERVFILIIEVVVPVDIPLDRALTLPVDGRETVGGEIAHVVCISLALLGTHLALLARHWRSKEHEALAPVDLNVSAAVDGVLMLCRVERDAAGP